MSFAALIPFMILILCFVGLRLTLARAAFLALLTGSLLTQTVFQATDGVWAEAGSKTLILMVEIGLILAGAFFFLETAQRTGVIDSLARMIRAVAPDPALQGILVTFPLGLMVEGSSGFGTPLLVIAPLLMALEFSPRLCVILPLLNLVIGIPYGALGTPTRLGFPGASPAPEIFFALAPFVLLTPQIALFLLEKRPRPGKMLWVLCLSLMYLGTGRIFASEGPELAALGPAFFSFGFGILTLRMFFPEKKSSRRIDLKGIVIYGLLLFTLWCGKRIFMDEKLPGFGVRIFNPGYVFLLFSLAILKLHPGTRIVEVARSSMLRARGTLTVLLCMTFLVQQLRANGGLELLTRAIPDLLLHEGTPLLGFLGSVFSGTSTLSNLLLSKVVEPVEYAGLAAGSALGVPLSFQTIVALRTLLGGKLTEKQVFLLLAPMSLSLLLLLLMFRTILP